MDKPAKNIVDMEDEHYEPLLAATGNKVSLICSSASVSHAATVCACLLLWQLKVPFCCDMWTLLAGYCLGHHRYRSSNV